MMRFSVKKNILHDYDDPVKFRRTPNVSAGSIDPKFVVMHYTASYEAEASVRHLCNPASKVSAHLVIGRDGSIDQLAEFNVRTWHAGPSEWKGWKNLNAHSIGIELVNIGFLRRNGNALIDSYGNNVPPVKIGPTIESEYARVGTGVFVWQTYTKEQLDTLEEVTRALVAAYGIIDVVGHEEIDTRGWKSDPGPAFPMSRFKSLTDFGESPSNYEVTASSLNVRGGPGTEFKVLTELKRGVVVSVDAVKGDWVRISDDGWVHSSFLKQIA